MKTILIEGWRFITSSYAVLTEQQCLRMLARSDIKLYFRDLPFWTPRWTHTRGLLPPDDDAALAALHEPPDDVPLDASLRIAHPTDVVKTRARHSWCWVIGEFGTLEQCRIADNRPVLKALRTPGVRLMTCSKWSWDCLVRSGADPKNITLVPLGYDERLFVPPTDEQRQAHRRELGWSDHFVFLNVGSLVWNKGVDGLLLSFAAVCAKHPQALLAIKGADQLFLSDASLKQAMSRLRPADAARIAPRIRYLGDHFTGPQMARLYQAADAYVSPYHAEGFNLPVLEAAACGLPSITTAGGPTDDFTTPEFAWRLPSRVDQSRELQEAHGLGARVLRWKPLDLISLMEQMITDAPRRERARLAGPPYVSARSTWQHATDQLVRALVPD